MGRGAPGVAGLAPGFVAQLGHATPAAVRRDGRASQVVGQQVVDRAVLPHGHPLAVGVVACSERSRRVLADGAPRLLVVVADVDRGAAAKGGLYPLAIAVVDVVGCHREILLSAGFQRRETDVMGKDSTPVFIWLAARVHPR